MTIYLPKQSMKLDQEAELEIFFYHFLLNLANASNLVFFVYSLYTSIILHFRYHFPCGICSLASRHFVSPLASGRVCHVTYPPTIFDSMIAIFTSVGLLFSLIRNLQYGHHRTKSSGQRQRCLSGAGFQDKNHLCFVAFLTILDGVCMPN